MTSVSILVPFAPAGPERDAAWAWNEQRWRKLLPDAEILVGSPDLTGDPARFNRPLAINRAAAGASGEVFIIGDADTACDPETIQQAIEAGQLVYPKRYVRLHQRVTEHWLSLPPDWPCPPFERDSHDVFGAVSGVVVMPRSTFEAVGGFDERFEGWGWDDGAFAYAASTVVGPWTNIGHAYHLWHPQPDEDCFNGPYAQRQRELSDRYAACVSDPSAMLSLIRERG